MIPDLIDKSIDRRIQLAKHKQEVNRNLYVDFADPAFAQFDSAHQDYLETFREYRPNLKDENTPFKLRRKR
jgi:hypothetical protein